MKTYNIACIPGDGIGKEVIPAGQTVLEVLAATHKIFKFDFTSFDWGGDYYRQHGVMMPQDGLDDLRKWKPGLAYLCLTAQLAAPV